MELPHLGDHCSLSACKKLNFLPIKCDACQDIFCEEHYSYLNHKCSEAYTKDNQVPVCPLCNSPVPTPRGQQPDATVGAHIDRDCQSSSAKDRRQVFTNKCSKKGCKGKEVIPVLCGECNFNFCLRHRHPTDHACEGAAAARRRKANEAAISRNKSANSNSSSNYSSQVQGNMTEDEALARALALSMQDTESPQNQRGLSQEERDLALALQLQQSESRSSRGTPVGGSRTRDRCNIA